MFPRTVPALLAAGLMLAAADGAAQSPSPQQQQIDWCTGKGDAAKDRTLVVKGCTALIDSGAYKDKPLALAYTLRGKAQSDNDKRKADFDKALSLDPSQVDALTERAQIHRARKDYDRALADISKAIALAPNAATPWVYQGDIYNSMDKDESALASWAEGIKRDPQWMWPYTNRGEFYLERGKYELAIKDFDASIQYASAYAMGWNNRCRANAILGQLDKALGDCNQALKISPDFVNTMRRTGKVSASQDRALVYLKAGRFKDAIADYDKALALVPDSAEVLYGRGLAKRKAGDDAGGEVDAKRAIGLQADIAARFESYGVK